SDGWLFLNRFFHAFEYEGLKEAGAKCKCECEEVVPNGSRKGKTGFADLFWPRQLITDN
ncbi:MAG: hypothetical protein F6K22_35990, partial [Okeania sp. SIO2F4]|nr:hypothetical protein [Okeania sp. SIO2F4]